MIGKTNALAGGVGNVKTATGTVDCSTLAQYTYNTTNSMGVATTYTCYYYYGVVSGLDFKPLSVAFNTNVNYTSLVDDWGFAYMLNNDREVIAVGGDLPSGLTGVEPEEKALHLFLTEKYATLDETSIIVIANTDSNTSPSSSNLTRSWIACGV